MKFSITFKYSNVVFKNKETKETVSYDTKADGNTFTFDNVDEDVVIGIVKGVKDRKASQVFAYDNLRTNFVNVIARNKCKELYDKLDKGEWKVEDVAISTATIKDLEFTKPTMNARENLTVESKKVGESAMTMDDYKKEADRIKAEIDGIVSNGGDLVDYFTDQVYGTDDDGRWIIGYGVYGPNGHIVVCPTCVTVYGVDSEPFGRETSKAMEEVMQMVSEGKGKKMKTNESISEKDYDLSVVIHEVLDEIDDIGISLEDGELRDKLWNVRTKLFNVLSNIKHPKRMKMGWSNESDGDEQVKVEFKKTPEDGEVIAFFPDTMKDGSCNPGMIMSYMHVGQHGEASVEFYNDCTTCLEEDYADLLAELEKVYDDCELIVVD